MYGYFMLFRVWRFLRNRQLFTFLIVATSSLAIGWLLWYWGANPNEQQAFERIADVHMVEPAFQDRCGVPDPERPVPVTLVYSPDKAAWVERVTAEFMRECVDTQIRLRPMTDAEAVAALVAGRLSPTLWMPTDELSVQRAERALDVTLERLGSPVRSPIVLLARDDRLRALDGLSLDRRSWMDTLCAGVPHAARPGDLPRAALQPTTWVLQHQADHPSPTESSAEYLRAWGRIRFAHSSPTADIGGRMAISLLSHEFLQRAAPGLHLETTEDLDRALAEHMAAFEGWLRRCEAGLSARPDATRELTQQLFALGGPRGYDGVLTFESMALDILEVVDENEEHLRGVSIVYPAATYVADHPVAAFGDEDDEGRVAASYFVEFLFRRSAQVAAIEEGLRPGADGVSLAEVAAHNPFLELRRYGVELDIPSREPPRVSAASSQALVEAWGRATGRG